MNISILKKNPKLILLLLGGILFLSSLYFHIQEDFFVYRAIRPLLFFTFFGFSFLYSKNDDRAHYIQLFLLFFAISSICGIWFEDANAAIALLIFNLLGYVMLGVYALKNVLKKKITPLYFVIFSILILANAYLLFEFIEALKNITHKGFFYVLLLVNIIAMVFMCFCALLYNHSSSSNKSINFTISVFILVFAEVFRAIGYYNIAYGFISVYIARFLLIVTAAMLVYNLLQSKNPERDILSEYL